MVEAQLQELFPHARILRMDADTTKGKDGHEKILSSFGDGKADILVGTQMIVKGHDFPNVTLVGILAADLSLHNQDYMAGERTFDLLTQAAGRAGRGTSPGTVVIQTYEPEHTVIQTAAEQNYNRFYENEIAYRTVLKYPPVYHMLAVLITAQQELQVQELSQQLAGYLRERYEQPEETSGLRIVGPATPVIGKIKDTYSRVLYLKSKTPELLTGAKSQLEDYISTLPEAEECRIYFDLNPMKGY
jgi:primosomal protein N' (replication factor Y)